MNQEKEIFNNEDYKYISNFVEEKLPILRQNKKFNGKRSTKRRIETSNLILYNWTRV